EEFEELEPSTWERFSSKFKEQPLVPIGAGATTIALLGAGRAIQQGNSSQFNLWLRYRVIFQGLTVAAALVGSLYYTKQRQIDRVALEEERIRKRDLRIREQESSDRSFSGSDQKVGSGLDLSGDRTRNNGSTSSTSEFRRELMRKKISDQAK
ncbi:hypoxia induced protein conserved region-domain-containing protein, partial [Phakopsora pachyrhizi]